MFVTDPGVSCVGSGSDELLCKALLVVTFKAVDRESSRLHDPVVKSHCCRETSSSGRHTVTAVIALDALDS